MSRLLEVIFTGWRKTGKLDLEAVETTTRTAAHHIGATVLSQLLSLSERVPSQLACRCGRQAQYHDTRPKQLQTVVGRVRFERAYYRCQHCSTLKAEERNGSSRAGSNSTCWPAWR